jgi:transcriptional antiterminator RfaH
MDWYVLHTKPHKERQVSSLFENQGYEVYLPVVRVRRRDTERIEPFFSCYLFARMSDLSDFCSVRWTPGLRSIVSFGDHPAVVPEVVISDIRLSLAEVDKRGYLASQFKPGDRVAIDSGPLAGFEGVFQESLSSRDRAKVLVDFMGRWTRCEVGIDYLEKAR